MKIKKIFKNLKKKYSEHSFKNINLDSRRCQKGDIFFSIKGTKFDGSRFINDAINNGAKTIVSNSKFTGFKDKVLYIYSINPKKQLLQTLSKLNDNTYFDFAAVTGTNGKSSIANFYMQILNICKIKSASIGTLGVDYGKKINKLENTTVDPITLNQKLLNLKKNKIKKIILEASSHGLDQGRLDNLKFSIGIFTNLSRDHLDYHKNYKNYFNSKMILFNKLMKQKGLAIYDSDTDVSKKVIKIIKKKKLRAIGVGFKNSDLIIKNIVNLRSKQFVVFKFKNKIHYFTTSLIGRFQVKNLLMAVAAASEFIPLDKIIKNIQRICSVSGRLEEIGKINNQSKVFLDYAHTPEALKSTILNIKNHFNLENIKIVFGCGGDRDKKKRSLMGRIANRYCNKIYLTDDNPRNENPSIIRKHIKKYINKKKLSEIPSRINAINQSINLLKSGEILIIAGKGHENTQEYKKKYFFSDKEEILKSIKKKNSSISKDWKVNLFNEHIKNVKLNKSTKINNIIMNSKDTNSKDIFFGIKGKKLNGNNYALESLKKGAHFAIVDKKKNQNKKLIKVKNSLKVFNEISQKIRKSSNILSVGITGSAGKTSLKNLVGQSLKKYGSTTFSKKSFNNKFGVPYSLANIRQKNIYGVFEIGMDRKGEIKKLSKLVSPNIIVITNISYAHIKNFKNLKGIALAKAEIIDNAEKNGVIFLNKDGKFYNLLKKKAEKYLLNVFSFSEYLKSDIQLSEIKRFNNYCFIKVKIFGNEKKFKIKTANLVYLPNILAAIGIIFVISDNKNIPENFFYNYEIPKGRGNNLIFKINNKNINIIDETYNSNPLSLNLAIKKFNNLKIKKSKKHALFGDMLELGKFSKKLHVQLAKEINRSDISKVHIFGNFIKNTFNKIKTEKRGKILRDVKEIENLMKNEINNRDYLLIKGSNGTGLNAFIESMKRKISYVI